MKVTDYNHKLGKKGWNNIRTVTNGGESWLDGIITLPEGYVHAYAQGDKHHFHHTEISFIHAGREYRRGFKNKRYTKRGIMRKAKQFVAEILAGELET